MAVEQLVNDFSTTITTLGGIDNVVTSFAVASSGSLTPNFRIRVDNELMLVTGIAGTTWTVTRGVEGTTAAPHSLGAAVYAVLTAGGLNQWFQDTPVLLRTPTSSYTILAGYSQSVGRYIQINTGIDVTVASGGDLYIS